MTLNAMFGVGGRGVQIEIVGAREAYGFSDDTSAWTEVNPPSWIP